MLTCMALQTVVSLFCCSVIFCWSVMNERELRSVSYIVRVWLPTRRPMPSRCVPFHRVATVFRRAADARASATVQSATDIKGAAEPGRDGDKATHIQSIKIRMRV